MYVGLQLTSASMTDYQKFSNHGIKLDPLHSKNMFFYNLFEAVSFFQSPGLTIPPIKLTTLIQCLSNCCINVTETQQ